jgi:hypothetical protein
VLTWNVKNSHQKSRCVRCSPKSKAWGIAFVDLMVRYVYFFATNADGFTQTLWHIPKIAIPQVDGRLYSEFIWQDIAKHNFNHDVHLDFECDISRQETSKGWQTSVAQVTLTYPLTSFCWRLYSPKRTYKNSGLLQKLKCTWGTHLRRLLQWCYEQKRGENLYTACR